MLALYGHPFSSYTWKAQIALHAQMLDYEFRVLDADHPEHGEFMATRAGPQGQFPVLVDGARTIFEATSIIEYLNLHHPAGWPLIPSDPEAALGVRMMDRVFDNHVMNVMQRTVNEYIVHPEGPDPAIVADVRNRLHRSYRWLEQWLEHGYHGGNRITLIECAAAPSLFYADWVEPIAEDRYPRLKAWRAQLNRLPEVARCIEAARRFRPLFPLGAPDRD
ncbi:glutathione S-transferase family protein [Novosphingobium sp. TH158]|uniref:glutathione S-transferase family protein n=1 Tax=Novosphingobium sp. TH158 TaxID=2067455 RepID=UPI0026A07A6F